MNCREQVQQEMCMVARLFNYFVGAREQGRWEGQGRAPSRS